MRSFCLGARTVHADGEHVHLVVKIALCSLPSSMPFVQKYLRALWRLMIPSIC